MVKQVKADPAGVDLRAFIRDDLDGCLFSVFFNQQGRAFAGYYYGAYCNGHESPFFPSDIDNYAIGVIGQERNYSDEIQDEAYLFISDSAEIEKTLESRDACVGCIEFR